MTKVTVDSELRSRLNNFSDLVEVCDENGRVVGFFHPVTTGNDECAGRTSSPIPDAEIERCRQQRTGRPLSDIFADLDRQK